MHEWLVMLVALPLAAALVTIVRPMDAARLGILSGLANLSLTLALIWQVSMVGPLTAALGGWQPGLGIALRADGLSLSLLLMVNLVALAASIYATAYFRGKDGQANRFWPLWQLLIAALHGLLLAGDLFNIYVGLELLGITAVSLAALGGTRSALDAALRYLVVGLLGSLMFLAGVALLYARYGTLDLLGLQGLLQPEPAAWVALALMSSGLLAKCALFPLHFWLPPAHSSAPAPVSAALSALVVKVAFYLLVRFWLELFPGVATQGAALVLGLLGAAAVLWGSWQALMTPRLKLLAAYSTVAQLGYLFMFLPLLLALPPGPAREIALGAMLLMALTHGFAKSALFLAAGIIQQSAGHDRIVDLGGTARSLPVTTFALALAGVALIGLPPSGAFLAKWELLTAAFTTGQWWWVPVVGVGSLLAAAYVFRVLGHVFGPGEGAGPSLASARGEVPGLLLAITATAVLGLGAASVWEFAAPGAFTGVTR